MEIGICRIQKMPTPQFLTGPVPAGRKNQLMISRLHIHRLVILLFIALVAIALIYGIKSGSITGIVLSLTSLGAGIHFLSLLAKARRELEQEQEEAV